MTRTILLCLALSTSVATAHAESRVSGDGFVVTVEAATDAITNTAVTARVVIAATGDYHVNKEFPTSLEVTAGDAVVIDRPRQGLGDAVIDDRHAVFTVRLTATTAGRHAVAAKVRFAICTADSCLPRRAALAWTLAAR